MDKCKRHRLSSGRPLVPDFACRRLIFCLNVNLRRTTVLVRKSENVQKTVPERMGAAGRKRHSLGFPQFSQACSRAENDFGTAVVL